MAGDEITPIVVVDANTIVEGSWWLDSAEWTVLLHLARTGRIRVVVPESVVIEAIARFVAKLSERDRKMRKAIDEVRRMLPRLDLPSPIDVDAEERRYDDAIRRKLTENDVAVPLANAVDLNELVFRAAWRGRPFDSNGHGFRDAIVWMLLRAELAANPNASATLVSNDNTFYDDDDRLHPELIEDAAPFGTANAVRSIRDFLESFGEADVQLLTAMVRALNRSRHQVEQEAVNALRTSDLRSPFGVVAQVATAQVVALDVVKATAVDDDIALGELSMRFEAVVEVHPISFGRPVRHPIVTTIDAVAAATFDRNNQTFGAIDIEPPSVEKNPDVLAWWQDASQRELAETDQLRSWTLAHLNAVLSQTTASEESSKALHELLTKFLQMYSSGYPEPPPSHTESSDRENGGDGPTDDS